jgi:hypothetical protein
LYAVTGVGGGAGIGEFGGEKRRWVAKGPRQPRWSTVKGMRVIWEVLSEWMTASMDEAMVVLPFKWMLSKWVLMIRGGDGWDLLERALDTGGIVASMPMVDVVPLQVSHLYTELLHLEKIVKFD